MAEAGKIPKQGSSNFCMSTKVYYQPRNDPTLPVPKRKVPNLEKRLRPVQFLRSATENSVVPIGDFDAFPIAEKTSPTQLFRFESRKGTDTYNEVNNDSVKLKAGTNKGAQRVSFTNEDLIDSEDLLRLECLQGGAFKMFIPSSPELERPPLCFEIKPPANVILDLPKSDWKPNIKVVVTTICSTGNPNDKSNFRTEGGMDVETSNLDDPEIEELIRQLCQVIVETQKKEDSSPTRKGVKEPPEIVELYKRKTKSRKPNANSEYVTYKYAGGPGDVQHSDQHDDNGYFYFQPQSEPKRSSGSLLDKICSCLGRTLGLTSSDRDVRTQAPMKMEVDNDPEEGYVRCLLMGKSLNPDDDDCLCDQQPVAEIRNSSELLDRQSPLVDRIMYLLRKAVNHKFSNEELVEGDGNGDVNTSDNGNDDDGSAGASVGKVDVHVDSKSAKKASHRKSSITKHHSHFGSDNNKEYEEEVREQADNVLKKKTGKKNAEQGLCCTHAENDNDKLLSLADSEGRRNVSGNDGSEEVDKIPANGQKKREKRKKKALNVAIEEKSSDSVEKIKSLKLDDSFSDSITRPSTSLEGIEPCEEDCKVARKMKRHHKMEAEEESTTDVVAENIEPPAPGTSKKEPSSGKSSTKKITKKEEKKEKKKERKESRERSKDGERKKMIGTRDKNYWASYRRLRRRQMDKPEAEFKESVVSASLLVDPLKMHTDSSSSSDSLIVDIETDISKHRRKNNAMSEKVLDLTTKRKSYGKLRNSPKSDDSLTSSLDSSCPKSVKEEDRHSRDDAVKSEPCKKSRKSSDVNSLREIPSGVSQTESQKGQRHRKAFKDVLGKLKTLRTSKSSTSTKSRSLCDDEHGNPPNKKSHTKVHRRKEKEMGMQMYISESPKEQDDATDPRNISAVMEAQALKDEVEKSELLSKNKRENKTNLSRNTNSNDVTNSDQSSTINLVLPCGTYPSEEADFVGLSSWKNPITQSTTAIDSKCETLCSQCMKSISCSPTVSQVGETSSPTESIASRKSILVDRRQPISTPRCSSSVYSMREVSLSGSPMGTIIPSVASLDTKLRQRGQLERVANFSSPTNTRLRPETDSSNQTLDSSSSAVTDNSSSVEVETKSTNFDSGTSVVSNVTIDSALSQNPFNASVKTKAATKKSNSSFTAHQLSSSTVDTWCSTSSYSDIQGNQSSRSYQETTSASDLTSGLSSDRSLSLIRSAIKSLPSDLKCDDGSLSLLGESSGDSRSTVALSATSAIDSGVSMDSQATSESTRAQDSVISRDLTAPGSVSLASRDSYQNDSRSQKSYTASKTGSQASCVEQLNRGASKRSVLSELSNSCLSQSAISLKLPRRSKAKSTTSISESNTPLLKGASPRSIPFASEKPAVMKAQSVDTVLAAASNTDASNVSPSKESSTVSINSAKQICMQVPDIGPTFTNAMISSPASCPGANGSTRRSDSDQRRSVESVAEAESLEGETTEFEKKNISDKYESCCFPLPNLSDDSLLRGEDDVSNSEENLDTDSGKFPTETLEQLPNENVPNERTTVEELGEKENNSKEVRPKKKKMSKRKHLMATFLCISKPCQSVRQSDSFAPYRPAQNTSGLDGPRNLSDTIPVIDRHPPSQPRRSKRASADHSKSKKTDAQETTLKERTASEEVKLKSILSKALYKDNRYKLLKKVSFSPNPSFIEAAASPEGSLTEYDILTIAELTKLCGLGLRESNSNKIVALTPRAEHFLKEFAIRRASNSKTSLNQNRGSFSGETNRDLLLGDESRFEGSETDDSDTCSSRKDKDGLNFETNSGKRQEPLQARLQLSNLMCESIPPKSSVVGFSYLDHVEQDDDSSSCGLALTETSEETYSDADDFCGHIHEKRQSDNDSDDSYSRNILSPKAKESKMCLVQHHDERCELILESRPEARELNFLKDCPIDNEDAKLEKQNLEREMSKKRKFFAQKVSSLMKVTSLDIYDENLAISEEKSTSRNSDGDEDRSPGQRGAPEDGTENDRQRKPLR